MIMVCVWAIFKGRLLPKSHFSKQESSALTKIPISSILSEEKEIVVSFAYIVSCALLKAKGRSLK